MASPRRLGVFVATWLVVMGVVWALFVPSPISLGTWTLLNVAILGAAVVLVMLRNQAPPVSVDEILHNLEESK